MSYFRKIRLGALSAGAVAALLGFAAVTSAQAQDAPAWNGAPNAPGPYSASEGYGYAPFNNGNGPAVAGYGPNYGGQAPGYGGNDSEAAYGVRAPYWLGAPAAVGPG